MNDQPRKDAAASAIPLALRPVDAAKSLGISPRKLWTMTQEHAIPHVRHGGVVLYPVEGLQQWLRDQSQPKLKQGGDA